MLVYLKFVNRFFTSTCVYHVESEFASCTNISLNNLKKNNFQCTHLGLEKANQLLEVKAALEQLTFNQLHSSTSTFSRYFKNW